MLDKYKCYENSMNVLLGKQIRYIGRASSLCWIGFGNDILVADLKGRERTVAEYSLHIQGSFRICERNIMRLSNLEMFIPNKNCVGADFFSWDIQGNNMFDINSDALTNIFENSIIQIENIHISDKIDLIIELSNDWCIEIFNNGIPNEEIWRFFTSGNESAHIVASSNIIKFE